ncbi:DNA polymerase III subunit gamma/tau [Microbacterium trichothecenolyticum]|uniref:DNA polymerase III subunit gamma/tau n=1 Tax=Microbacterium trichothecenolyticum TaxID=69370 RepID=UPI0027D83B35|nr:DNA polymerase III subunit gamma/tau [Microbacterium trichothecenolyticum]
MSTPRDDDALSWGGDDDPTLDVGDKRSPEHPRAEDPEPLAPERTARRSPSAPTPDAGTETVAESPASVSSPDDDAPASRPLGNAGLIGIGMVAATFLLFALGWLLAGRQLQSLGIPIPDVTVVAMTIGATAAPLVWFVTVLVFTRGWRAWQRFLLLILGIVLLVPWPLLSMGDLA